MYIIINSAFRLRGNTSVISGRNYMKAMIILDVPEAIFQTQKCTPGSVLLAASETMSHTCRIHLSVQLKHCKNSNDFHGAYLHLIPLYAKTGALASPPLAPGSI